MQKNGHKISILKGVASIGVTIIIKMISVNGLPNGIDTENHRS